MSNIESGEANVTAVSPIGSIFTQLSAVGVPIDRFQRIVTDGNRFSVDPAAKSPQKTTVGA